MSDPKEQDGRLVRAARIAALREKIAGLTNDELIALAMVFRRGGEDLREELTVLNEALKDRHDSP